MTRETLADLSRHVDSCDWSERPERLLARIVDTYAAYRRGEFPALARNDAIDEWVRHLSRVDSAIGPEEVRCRLGWVFHWLAAGDSRQAGIATAGLVAAIGGGRGAEAAA